MEEGRKGGREEVGEGVRERGMEGSVGKERGHLA